MKKASCCCRKVNLTICLLAVTVLVAVLFCCSPIADTSVPESNLTKEEEPSPTLLDERPYTGDGSTYTYITTEGRDREWEEDIVYFANTFLDTYTGHPKLVDRGCTLRYTNELRDRKSVV